MTKEQYWNRKRFNWAKEQILQAAMNQVDTYNDSFVTNEVVTAFAGYVTAKHSNQAPNLYGRAGLKRAVSIKDNNSKSDNGLGMFLISRKIPVTQVKNLMRQKGMHKLLGKHIKHPSVQKQINDVLDFIEAQQR